MVGRVAGKVALVTGGSRGIGKAISSLLAKEGATVFVTDIDEKAGNTLVQDLTAKNFAASFLRLNTADEANWKSVFEQVKAQHERLDILVNNAGIGVGKSVLDTSLELWRKTLNINLDGVFLGTKYAIELMKPNKSGSIINMSSIEGLVGDPNLCAYNASKGGTKLFTMSAALDVAKLGIRVNTVHPGYIETDMVKQLCIDSEPDQPDWRQTKVYQSLASKHPVGHLGQPEDIANGVLFLASDESKFVTGSQLVIDGGYTAQ